MTFPNPKWFTGVSTVLDNAAAVDKGGGSVGLPITGHSFAAGQVVIFADTVNYNGAYTINSQTANEIVITATYVAEVFAGTETVVFGRQPIVKQDFSDLEDEILLRASKAWCYFQKDGTVLASYNITNVTDNGTGDWTVNFTINFSSALYCVVASLEGASGSTGRTINVHTKAAGYVRLQCLSADALADPITDGIHIVCYGAQ